MGLIQVMIVTFGDAPPVYAKPKESAAPYPTQRKQFFNATIFSEFSLTDALSILAFMPQPSAGGPSSSKPYLPYPATGNNCMPYPSSNFGNFPQYPAASGSNNQPAGTGYPPYMPPSSSPGYNNMYGSVSIHAIRKSNFSVNSEIILVSFHLLDQ